MHVSSDVKYDRDIPTREYILTAPLHLVSPPDDSWYHVVNTG